MGEETEAIFKTAFMMVADACYIATLEEGRILEVNKAFEDLIGRSRDEVIGRTSRELDIWVDYADRIRMRETLKAAGFVSQLETRGRKKGGECFDCSASASVVTVAGVPCVIGVLRDITGRKQAEQAVRESEAKFKTAFMTSPHGFYLVALPEGRFIEVNPAFEAILGYSAREAIGRTSVDLQLFVDPDFRERTLKEELLPKGFVKNKEVRLRTKSGTVIVAELSIRLLTLNGQPCTLGTFTDITERWRAEQSVRDLSGRLINAQEAERSRLGRELHDNFCQSLALLAVKLDHLGQAPLESEGVLREATKVLRRDVDVLLAEVRQLSHDLHPGRLEQLGLTAALRGLCNDVSAAHSLAIRFEARDVPGEVPDAVALCVYRVAQEALQNVVKHSDAGTASVELAGMGGDLRLVVTDDGRGFETAAAPGPDSVGLGLANMRERVRFASGRLAIECPADGGTRVEARVPCAAPAEPSITKERAAFAGNAG